MNRTLAIIASLLFAAPAFAQWPTAPSNPPPKSEPTVNNPPPSAPPPRRPVREVSHGDDGSGFGLGVRAAWAKPYGGLTSTETLDSNVSGALPLWLEAGYHFNSALYIGAYFQYALGLNNCLGGADCSSSGMRFGLEALYHFGSGSMQPFVGLGFGYEIFNVSRSAGDDRTFKGLEMLNVQLGLDYWVSKTFSIGPFASYQLFGKYTSDSASGFSNDISDTTGHSWLQLGLKLGFKL